MSESSDHWIPSNGTDLMDFEARFCDQCERDKWDGEQGEQCEILNGVLSGEKDPEEWRIADGKTFCTAFHPEGWEPTPVDMRARCRCSHSGAWHEGTTGRCRRPECECEVMAAIRSVTP